jgi:ATP-binding cassette, subfamily B, bacterial PglK
MPFSIISILGLSMFGKQIKSKTIINISKIWKLIDFKTKSKLKFLLFYSVIVSIADLISLGSIIPFVAALVEIDKLWEFSAIERTAYFFGINTSIKLTISFALIFAISALLSAIIKLYGLRYKTRLSAEIAIQLSGRMILNILTKPYIFHTKVNSGQLINLLTFKLQRTELSIDSLMDVLSGLATLLAVLIALLIVNPVISISVIAIFSFVYYTIFCISKKYLGRNSSLISDFQDSSMQILQESLGSIRDIVLDSSANYYANIYQEIVKSQKNRLAQNMFISGSPRFALEGLSLILFSFIALYLIFTVGPISTLPILSIFAFATQKSLPSMQQVYIGWARAKAVMSETDDVIRYASEEITETNFHATESFDFQSCLEFKDVNFKYSDEQNYVIKNANIIIKKGDIVGVIGNTGGGKSTFIDLLMCLLSPNSGKILIDDLRINSTSIPNKNKLQKQWMSLLSHVPQTIYLQDRSITENIAFGIDKSKINFDDVIKASKNAAIFDTVMSMTNGFDTRVGDKGIQLSGGQKQRIAIARALYRKSKVLILDEATSALDPYTEKKVIENILSSNESITIIMIAHRLSTLHNCTRLLSVKENTIFEEDIEKFFQDNS